MSSTGTGYSAGEDLGTFGNELAKTGYILIINAFYIFGAEMANFLSGLAVHRTISFFHCENLL
jgi:hypothetical protein